MPNFTYLPGPEDPETVSRHGLTFTAGEWTPVPDDHAATQFEHLGNLQSLEKAPEFRGFAQGTCTWRLKIRQFRRFQRAHRPSVSGRIF
jgi:hypothetical protein